MWIVPLVLAIVWFVLTFLLHKSGYVHIILIAAVSIFVVALTGYRNTQYHKRVKAVKR
jgi:uncharacterized membrane protein